MHELHATAISMYITEIKDKILEAANADLQYKRLVAKLQQPLIWIYVGTQ